MTGLEAEVDEGLMLLAATIRMRLKNRMVVDILTSDGAVDTATWTAEVVRTLGALEDEARGSAERSAAQARAARFVLGRAEHQWDYRAADRRNLGRRRRVHSVIAARLSAWQQDPDRVRALLEDARAAALDEIDAAITTLVTDAPATTETDELLLRERLSLVATVDLPALAAALPVEPVRHAPAPRDRIRRALRRGSRRG